MDSFEQFEPDLELEEDNSGIWLSISDLMSGLLMFFALLFIVVQVQLQEKVVELEEKILEAQKLEQDLKTYQKIIDGIPQKIKEEIEEKFGKGFVELDRGGIKISNHILFDEGSAELKPAGEEFLNKFIPIYSSVIFSDEFLESQINSVVVEGHTSSQGSEQANMELSLRRSLSVSNYIFSKQLNFEHKQKFKQKMLVSGRGEIDADRSQDNPSDRKVVFHLQFLQVNPEDLKQDIVIPSLQK